MYELTIRWLDTSYYDTPVTATQADSMVVLRRRLVQMIDAHRLTHQGDGQVGLLLTPSDTVDGKRVVGIYEFTTTSCTGRAG